MCPGGILCFLDERMRIGSFFVCQELPLKQAAGTISIDPSQGDIIVMYVEERNTTVSVFQPEPTEQNHEQASEYEGPYPSPQRACYVCGKRAWTWNGEGYRCASGESAHEDYERLTWTDAGKRKQDA